MLRSRRNLIQTFNIQLDLKRYPYSFLGGQRQLISIMRALVADPEVLFLDEPFLALGFETTLSPLGIAIGGISGNVAE